MLLKVILTCVILVNFGFAEELSEGDQCTKLDKEGICVNLHNCTSAREEIKNKIFPKVCSIKRDQVIVCCFDSTNNTYEDIRPTFISIEDKGALKEPGGKQNTTDYNYGDIEGEDVCPPMPATYTTPKTGQIAWDKCIEYQHKYVFPCERFGVLNRFTRLHKCAKSPKESLVVGSNGVDANPHEFGHMALLGFGEDVPTSQWLCGGSIISERYILTAGHCVFTPRWGNVTRIASGILRKSDVSKGQIYNVKTIVVHPKFKPPSKYNDIALLETQEEIRLSEYQIPACIHTGKYSDRAGVAIATGWGALWYRGERPDILQKMTLKEFQKDSCKQHYHIYRLLKKGFDEDIQLCYGDPVENTDTCDGDSGGPLQILHPSMYCMHLIIGVTSFGNPCGRVNQPAVYTKVDSYVSWIESIVWHKQ